MDQNPLPQEFRLIRIFLAINFISALLFMAVSWKFVIPGKENWIWLILLSTMAYCGLLYRLATPTNYRRISAVFILLLAATDYASLLLQPQEYFFTSFLLVTTFVIVFNVVLVSWPEILALDGLILVGSCALLLASGSFRGSAKLLGMDEKFLFIAILVYEVLLLVLGTGIAEIKRRTEGRLRFLNDTLNRRVEEKVAEIQRADREARQYQEQLEKILRHTPVGVVIIDEALNFLYTNGVHFKFETLNGEVRELPGGILPLQVLKETLLQAKADSLLERQENLTGQRLEYTAPDGFKKIIRYNYVCVKLEGENGQITRLILITEDITAEEGLRLELMQSEHLAALGKMAASLAHEINNPLAGIKLYIELLEQNLAAPEKRQQIFATLENSITRIDRIIKNFLSFARQDQPQKEWIDVLTVLQGTLDMAANFKQFHQIHICTDFSKDIPQLCVDQYRLAQVFVNLLNNASDAMAESGGRLKISCQQDGREVFIRFQDTGKGIKQEDLPRIFTPFFTTKERGYGTGLGLSTSYGIIQEHGGILEVESREGQGSSFTIRLPIHSRE